MSGIQAKEYGLVDEVISSRQLKPKEDHPGENEPMA
jgi:ATP-dependent protease ClpP protease subunit